MRVTLKTGRREGMVACYALEFGNGLVLRTPDLTFRTQAEKKAIRAKFEEALDHFGVSVELEGRLEP